MNVESIYNFLWTIDKLRRFFYGDGDFAKSCESLLWHGLVFCD